MGNVMNMGATAPSDAETPLHNDYVQRLSAQDLKRYTEGFRRVCRVEGDGHDGNAVPPPPPPLPPKGTMHRPSGNNVTNGSVNPMSVTSSAGISKKLFRSKLLSAFPLIPHSLSDRLFDVLDTDGRGELTVENVLRGIALLKHGTRDEHLQLLFTIYDLDSTGLLARDVLDRFMDVVYGRRKARQPSTVALLNRVFGERKTLTLEEFKAIAEDKDEQGHAVLLEWLYALSDKIGRVDDEQIVELEKRYNPVVIRHRIAESTLFSPGEVSTLEKQFHKLFDTKGGASNRIPCDQFIDLMTRYEFPRHILERACSGSHVTVPGMVLFDEFCQIISNYCRGKVEVKCRHLFHLFCEPDGLITSCGIHDMLRQNTDNGDQNGIQNGYSRHQAKKNEAQALPDGDFRWSEDEFVEWAAESSTAQYMLHQMAFTACILFGVKPESGYLEKWIVEWHWLEATQQVEVGQTWNFIATKWWLQWCKFVGMDEANGTPLGTTLSIPQVPQEALSQDYSPGEVNVLSHVSRPGHIANWSILKTSGSRRLKEKLIIGRDFHLIPSSVYAILSHWYSGGPELSRRVIQLNNNVMQVELFPLVLRVARVDSSNGSVIMSGEEVILNRLSTVDTLLQACCKALLLTKFVEKSRLWFFDESNPDHKYRLRSRRPKDLKRLTQSSVFLIEVQDDDGSWPLSQLNSNGARTPDESDIDEEDSVDFIQSSPDDAEKRLRHQTSPLRRTSEICSRGNLETLTALGSSKHSTVPNNGKPPTAVEDEGLATAKTLKRRFSRNAFSGAGLVGLDNLGNTCYMSSALQCMSHTRLLVDYFKNEEYLHDINLHNRDGTNGKLAVAFGELLRVLWTSEKKRFAPTEFKRVLARFNPQFVGSDQHDAQELLACLLSGLSEDLNRIVKKPYIEQPDSDGRCDTIVANEWWQNHLQREFSVIVALFTGQYKSLLECSICHYESARFEPFTFLQLSLPESSFRSILVTVIFNNGRVPMKYSVRVRNDGKIEDVQTEVVDLIRRMDKRDGVPRRENIYVVVARISALHTIDAILEPKTPLLHIHERQQLSAYELDDLPEVAPTLSLKAFTSQHQGSLKKSISSSSPTAGSEHSHQASTVPNSPTATTRTSSPTGSEKHTVEESEHESESQDSGGEEDHPPFAVGSSVYVRADKTHDFLAARVIGGSTKNGPTVDVAYPSGMRRYHVPISKVLERRREDAFIFLVHRRVERSVNSFAEAHVTRLFGAPLTLRVSLRATSNFDLYLLVWRRLCRIFNWQSPPSAKSMEELLREDTLRGDEDQQQQLQRTGLSTVALGRHLAWTKFGFCLRMVTSHGIGCSRCDWLEGCLGCVILPSPTTGISVTAEETIAIDWDIRTLKEEYDPIQASKLDTHESVQINHRLENMPLNIHRCLEIFTAKEHISEAYCGRCKTLRPAEKTMDLWRLPPILVIQLKRFCYTQTSRRKLHHFVDFPLTGLNLEDFVAKKREPKRFHETGLVYWRFLGGKLKEQYEDDDQACTNGEDVPPKVTSARQFSTASTTSLLEAPATAAERADETFLYDLYAVVNHVGALGAGHYFAYVHSEDDNKWKCFNDHQCKDIDAKEVVSSSAYILFYRRRDMKDVHIEDLFPPIRRKSAGETAEVEDGANDDRAKVEELVEQTKAATNGSGCIIS